jgi:hypothetical protein
VVRKSINKSIVKGAKYQTVKGSGILYSSITKPAMDKPRHKTETRLRNLSRLSGIMFLNTKAEIPPIKINVMIIISIRLTNGVRDLSSKPHNDQLLPAP